MRPADTGNDAELDLGLAELGGVGSDDESHIIASSQPPPSAKPATAAMIGFFDAGKPSQAATKSSKHTSRIAKSGHLLDIGARGERLVGPGDDNGPDAGVTIEGGQRGGHLARHGTIERVERLRPVEGDQADPSRVSTRMVLRGLGVASGLGMPDA